MNGQTGFFTAIYGLTAVSNQRVAMNILGQNMTAAVLRIKAFGGGWSASDLPNNGTFVNQP